MTPAGLQWIVSIQYLHCPSRKILTKLIKSAKQTQKPKGQKGIGREEEVELIGMRGDHKRMEPNQKALYACAMCEAWRPRIQRRKVNCGFSRRWIQGGNLRTRCETGGDVHGGTVFILCS